MYESILDNESISGREIFFAIYAQKYFLSKSQVF